MTKYYDSIPDGNKFVKLVCRHCDFQNYVMVSPMEFQGIGSYEGPLKECDVCGSFNVHVS